MEVKYTYLNIGGYCIKADLDMFTPHALAFKSFVCDKKDSDFELEVVLDNNCITIEDDKVVDVTEDGYKIELKNQNVLSASKDWRKWSIYAGKKNDRIDHVIYYELKKPFSYAVLPYGGVVFHGVVLEWNGKGIILCAESAGGKTTHARMWRDYENALVINGDRALCRKVEGVWHAFGQPWCGTSGEFVNRKIKIDVFVMLEKSKRNMATRLNPYEAFLNLAEHVFAPKWSVELMNYALDYIDDMVTSIPMLKLECVKDYTAVETLKKAILDL
jgi:hypothetical protein